MTPYGPEQGDTTVEPSIAVNPTDPSNVVAGANDFRVCCDFGGDQDSTAWAYWSRDGAVSVRAGAGPAKPGRNVTALSLVRLASYSARSACCTRMWRPSVPTDSVRPMLTASPSSEKVGCCVSLPPPASGK